MFAVRGSTLSQLTHVNVDQRVKSKIASLLSYENIPFKIKRFCVFCDNFNNLKKKIFVVIELMFDKFMF